jgi:hypothetical protein
MYEGAIVGEFPPDVSEEELGIAMTGGGRQRDLDRPDADRRSQGAGLDAPPR